MKRKRTNFVRWVALCLSSTFFSGFLPGKLTSKPGAGGGTAGSIVACIALLVLRNASFQTIAVIAVASFIVGWIAVVPAERLMAERWGKRKRHTGEVVDHDFNETNIDEFHGQFVAVLPIWFFDLHGNLQFLAIFMAFLLFRVCDTEKPWPISQTEKLFSRSAFGIMVDDTLAGGMTAVIMGIFVAVFGRM